MGHAREGESELLHEGDGVRGMQKVALSLRV